MVSRTSAYEVHLAWVGLVAVVMMEVYCTVQDCSSYLGHCQAAVEDRWRVDVGVVASGCVVIRIGWC